MAKTNVARFGYSWNIGTPKDTRMIIKYFNREIGRAHNFLEAKEIQEKHYAKRHKDKS